MPLLQRSPTSPDPRGRPTHEPSRRPRSSARRLAVLALASLLTIGTFGTAGATAAQATDGDDTITNASFEWGINNQHQLGSQFGGCDYFSAGLSDGSASQYRTKQGNVQIIKHGADGSISAVGLANRCTPATADGSLDNGQRLLLSAGTGSVNRATGETTIAWTGVATINSYGGLVPWSITDPTLTVAADGTGSLRATLGGWASSMDDPNTKTPLPPTPDVVLADFSNVTVGEHGITATPLFGGIDYFPLVGGERSTTSAITDAVKIQRPEWGSWPQSFVDFQYRTGLSTYWHTSGLSADSKKPPLPITVAFDASPLELSPVIVRGPAATTVSSGGTATFSTEVAGDPMPTIQWQSIRPGGDWTDLAGETGTTLTLSAVPFSDNGLTVRAVATNTAGTAVSQGSILTVDEAAAITIVTQPQSVTAKAGAIIRLSVSVTGSSPRYQWQRSTDGGGTWLDWGTNAATSGNLPTASAANSGDQYRVIVSNGISEPVVSEVATVTLTTQPTFISSSAVDAMGFVGGKVIFRVYGGGSPDPAWEWQQSSDGGTTWTTFSTAASSLIYVENLTASMDGTLYRAVASNGAGPDAISTPSKLTVLPQTTRSVLYSPSAEIDPSVTNSLALSGAGFRVPDSYSSFLRVGIVEANGWGDGSTPTKDAFIGDSATIFAATLKRDAGTFARTLTIQAGTLDPTKRYLLVSFSAAAGDASLTNSVPLVLTGSDFATTTAPAVLDDPSGTGIPAMDLGVGEAVVGSDVVVANLEPNSWFFVTVYSDATPLGWHKTDATGSAVVTLPDALEPGTHSIQVQNSAGVLRGWQSFVLTAAVSPTVSPTDPATVPPTTGPTDPAGTATPASGPVGTETTSATADQLSSTGLTVWPLLAAAAVILLLGTATLTAVRRRAASHQG